VAGAGATTLPVYIFGMIRIGVTPEVNALSSLMLLISILFVSLSFLVGRLRQETGSPHTGGAAVGTGDE